MKFTPEVIAAIQTLRDNADNDFERHRIDVLERDLTAPPQVEQIDGTHQRFNGEIYTKNHKNQYKRHYSVHRVLYSYYHGDIPDGYDIHHIDGDASHNTIENLQCLTRSEHMAIHYTENKMRDMRDARRTKHFVCEVCGAEFSSLLTGAKYCSIKCQKKPNTSARKKVSRQNVNGVARNF